jgi:hypothetical protein
MSPRQLLWGVVYAVLMEQGLPNVEAFAIANKVVRRFFASSVERAA